MYYDLFPYTVEETSVRSTICSDNYKVTHCDFKILFYINNKNICAVASNIHYLLQTLYTKKQSHLDYCWKQLDIVELTKEL